MKDRNKTAAWRPALRYIGAYKPLLALSLLLSALSVPAS